MTKRAAHAVNITNITTDFSQQLFISLFDENWKQNSL